MRFRGRAKELVGVCGLLTSFTLKTPNGTVGTPLVFQGDTSAPGATNDFAPSISTVVVEAAVSPIDRAWAR